MRFIIALMLVLGSLTAAVAQTLQPGDTIDVSVWQDSKLDRRVLIGPSGMISFPLAGHIRAAGITPQALEDILRNRLQKNYTDRLDITVSLASSGREEEDRKPRFYVTGEINRPGPYIMTTRTNVMQAIAQAGGLGIFAAKSRIQIRRVIKGVDSIHVFDYYAFETGADTTGNIDIKSGDVIIVPERGLFFW